MVVVPVGTSTLVVRPAIAGLVLRHRVRLCGNGARPGQWPRGRDVAGLGEVGQLVELVVEGAQDRSELRVGDSRVGADVLELLGLGSGGRRRRGDRWGGGRRRSGIRHVRGTVLGLRLGGR